MDWLDLLEVQGTLKTLLQHHSSKASIVRHSAFFVVKLSHPYTITGKTIALTRWIFFGKVMSLLFNMLSRLVITFLPRSLQTLLPSLVTSISGCCFCFDSVHSFFLISLLISSSILGIYQTVDFIIQCPIFLPFHTCSWDSQGKNT